MAKLCPKGKAAAKRKFKVYPSAYANMYASGVCSGKITPGGKKGRTKKAEGGGVDTGKEGERRSRIATVLSRYTAKTRGGKRQKKNEGGSVVSGSTNLRKKFRELKEPVKSPMTKVKSKAGDNARKIYHEQVKNYEKLKSIKEKQNSKRRVKKMGGGMMTQPRAMYGKGGGVCIRGMNRDAIGKNS